MKLLKNRDLGIKKFRNKIREYFPNKWLLWLATTLIILQAGFSLAVPYLTMNFIDNMSSLATLDITTILLIGAVFLLQLIISSFSLYMLTRIGEQIALSLRSKTWNKILELPIPFFDSNSSGSLMSRITNDILIIKEFMVSQLIPFFSGFISIVGSIIFLLVLDTKMTLLIFVIIPVIMIVITPFGRKMYTISRSLQDETASFQGELGRVLTDIRLVKSSLAEKHEKETGHIRIKSLFRYGIKEGKINAIIQPLSMSLMLVTLLLIFGYGSIRVSAGTLSAGTLVAIIFYLFQISVPISTMTRFFTEFKKAQGATERIGEIHSLQSEEASTQLGQRIPDNHHDTIEFHNISFYYKNGKKVLEDIKFQVGVGEVTAFVGPSGAGKTTIFSLLERFYQPEKGEITYKGMAINRIPLNEWRKKIAYVSQESPVMDGTILSNLVYGLDYYTEEQVKKAISNANLEEFIDSLPEKYNTEVGERGVRLSGGQKQRIAIARAMIRNPEILLLDEATAHLDSNSEKLVQDALEQLMKDRTTLIIAHRLSTVRNANQLIVIENGHITGKGVHEDLLKIHPLYKELYEQQTIRTEELTESNV
ncbi:ABC transporter ATP-binding protein [Paucisalibacillus globulus]|uniref:ABC transporter ATP-binding protein n=1 Tax=Paucisalibacillus globulus TaxID=351095 RepID=UPI00041FA621|nr:ABC transporter ATP-binding protein [Paucisalibacillus globulus]